MSEQKPLCPYCGAEMKIHVHEFYDGAYCSGYALCPECGSYSPSIAGDISKEQLHDEVKAAALRHPLQKPLTLEELHALIDAGEEAVTYCEAKDDPQTYACIWYDGKSVDRDAEAIDSGLLVYEHYGIDWRAWANRPTDEARAAAPWEE